MTRRATGGDAKDVAVLHMLTLSDSIFARLGGYFLEHYYHTMLCRADHVFSYVYEYKGKIVGFIAMAASHKSFYGQIRKDLGPISLSLLNSIARSPASVFDILKAVLFLARKDDLVECDAQGELLQIAVDPGYRARSEDGSPSPFFSKTGLKVAEELFLEAVAELKRRKIRSFRIMTGDSNAVSNKFYMKMGCEKFSSGVKIFNSPTSIYRGDVEGILGIFHHTGV